MQQQDLFFLHVESEPFEVKFFPFFIDKGEIKIFKGQILENYYNYRVSQLKNKNILTKQEEEEFIQQLFKNKILKLSDIEYDINEGPIIYYVLKSEINSDIKILLFQEIGPKIKQLTSTPDLSLNYVLVQYGSFFNKMDVPKNLHGFNLKLHPQLHRAYKKYNMKVINDMFIKDVLNEYDINLTGNLSSDIEQLIDLDYEVIIELYTNNTRDIGNVIDTEEFVSKYLKRHGYPDYLLNDKQNSWIFFFVDLMNFLSEEIFFNSPEKEYFFKYDDVERMLRSKYYNVVYYLLTRFDYSGKTFNTGNLIQFIELLIKYQQIESIKYIFNNINLTFRESSPVLQNLLMYAVNEGNIEIFEFLDKKYPILNKFEINYFLKRAKELGKTDIVNYLSNK